MVLHMVPCGSTGSICFVNVSAHAPHSGLRHGRCESFYPNVTLRTVLVRELIKQHLSEIVAGGLSSPALPHIQNLTACSLAEGFKLGKCFQCYLPQATGSQLYGDEFVISRVPAPRSKVAISGVAGYGGSSGSAQRRANFGSGGGGDAISTRR